MPARTRNVWVFVHGERDDQVSGAEVEIVEARRTARASHGGPDSGGYRWALFHDLPHGEYTVRVRFPSGAEQARRVRIADDANQVRFDA
ncbi:MAG: hypothetical protein U0531_04510 [Dehalococcoidia bacterium]